MEAVPDAEGAGIDPFFKLPTRSLYGADVESLTPDESLFENIDAIVYDVQDIGTRYYTYAATLALTMETASRTGTPVWVLDRPNPIGPDVEGPLLQPGYESFVGLEAGLPIRHGMTVGELAQWYGVRRAPDCELHVVPCSRHATSLWIPPSPNMPTVDTAIVYPGMCLLEGTSVSEGRGTTTPFLLFGAPGVDPLALTRRLMSYDCPGVDFIPRVFRPEFGKHAGQACGGATIRVFDPTSVRAVTLGLYVLESLSRLAPEAFGWRHAPYEFVKDIPAIDLLWGSSELREVIDAGADVQPLIKRANAEAASFKP